MSDKWETVGKPAKVVKGKGNGAVSNNNKKVGVCTLCPRSSDPFHIVTYYVKWVTISWTDGSMLIKCDTIAYDLVKEIICHSTKAKLSSNSYVVCPISLHPYYIAI